jgi:hypothetical protein
MKAIMAKQQITNKRILVVFIFILLELGVKPMGIKVKEYYSQAIVLTDNHSGLNEKIY